MNRRGLGRGLAALIPTATPEMSPPVERSALQEPDVPAPAAMSPTIPLASIQPNPLQPRRRFDEAELSELVESIRNHGILQPVVVRRKGDSYELIAGERRWRAAQRAGLTEIPVVIRSSDDREALEIALIENLQREDINPVDAAGAYQRLSREFGLTQEMISQRIGKSRPAIANTLRLLELPAEVLSALREGRISEGHARTLLGLGDQETMKNLCKEIVARNITVRDLEVMVKKLAAGKPSTRKTRAKQTTRTKDPNLLALEEKLRHVLQTNVFIKPARSTEGNGDGGVFEIVYYSAEEFERILDKLMGS